MAYKREDIGSKRRFEVLSRDNFTCQYCGRKPPEVKLNCDHIEPVAKGGGNEMENLITSCSECNLGKSDNDLSVMKRIEFCIDGMRRLNSKRAISTALLESEHHSKFICEIGVDLSKLIALLIPFDTGLSKKSCEIAWLLLFSFPHEMTVQAAYQSIVEFIKSSDGKDSSTVVDNMHTFIPCEYLEKTHDADAIAAKIAVCMGMVRLKNRDSSERFAEEVIKAYRDGRSLRHLLDSAVSNLWSCEKMLAKFLSTKRKAV